MKFSLYVNQKQAIELGLDYRNALILHFLIESASWATPEKIDNEIYFWVSRNKICEEHPILKLQPDSMYRKLKKLRDLGLIFYKTINKKDFIKITKKGKNLIFDNKMEKNPSLLGKKSESCSEKNPTYKIINTHQLNKSSSLTLKKYLAKIPEKYKPALIKKIMDEDIGDDDSEDLVKELNYLWIKKRPTTNPITNLPQYFSAMITSFKKGEFVPTYKLVEKIKKISSEKKKRNAELLKKSIEVADINNRKKYGI